MRSIDATSLKHLTLFLTNVSYTREIRRIRSQGEGITVDTTAASFLGGKKAEDGSGGNVLSMVSSLE